METSREDIINIYDTLPARYNIGFSEIREEPKPIASGMFGSVHRGRWGDRAVAVKKFDLDNTDHNFNLVSKEMSRMIRLRHQNVLNVYGFYFVAKGQVLKSSMVMELMDFDLYKYIEQERGERSPLTDDEVVYIIAEIARGMKHVHENGYSHRDLKPQNVLMRRSAVLSGFHLDVKVADFGSSELMSGGVCDRTAGTSRYKAPEQFDRDACLRPDKMDVYSFGCVCFKVWTGEDPPFKNHVELMELWKQRRAWNSPGDVEGIITECLDTDPDARPGFSKISGALDAVLKERQVKQESHHRTEVTDEEAADVVVRRREIVRELGLGRGVNGLDYADYVILPEEVVVLRKVGTGMLAKVYEVDWKGTPCALKVIDLSISLSTNLDADLRLFKRLPSLIHNNIVRFLGYSLPSSEGWKEPWRQKRFGIIMEFLGSDLGRILNDFGRKHNSAESFPEQRRRKIMQGIAEGMKFLHGKGWVHGDLKPENVMVNVSDQAEDADDIVVKLIDFILIRPNEHSYTVRYAAPELQRYYTRRRDYKKSDVYSFAITCSDILGEDEDFGRKSQVPSKFRKQVIWGMRPKLPKETSRDLRHLITRCWSHDPAKRPTFVDICKFFSPPVSVHNNMPSPQRSQFGTPS